MNSIVFSSLQAERIFRIVERIKKLCKNPAVRRQVLQLKSPWALTRLGLNVSDLNPTLAEAELALREAQQQERKKVWKKIKN